MKLLPDTGLQVRPGSFSVRIEGDVLVIPAELARFARDEHLCSAEELVGYLQAFPSSIASPLGWKHEAVVAATQQLRKLLTAAGIPEPAVPQPRVYGL
jgi:hypothetical protein